MKWAAIPLAACLIVPSHAANDPEEPKPYPVRNTLPAGALLNADPAPFIFLLGCLLVLVLSGIVTLLTGK